MYQLCRMKTFKPSRKRTREGNTPSDDGDDTHIEPPIHPLTRRQWWMINDRIRVRNAITPSKVLTAEEKKWVMRTPKDIRAHAVFQAVAAFKVGFSQLRSGVTNTFVPLFSFVHGNVRILLRHYVPQNSELEYVMNVLSHFILTRWKNALRNHKRKRRIHKKDRMPSPDELKENWHDCLIEEQPGTRFYLVVVRDEPSLVW